jgi:hypothetical protein
MPHGCTADLRLKSTDPNGSPNQRSATTPHDHSDDCGQRSCLHHSAHFAASLKGGATSRDSRLVQASCHDRDAIKRNTIHERDCVRRSKTNGRFGGSRTRKTADGVQRKRLKTYSGFG